MAGPQPQLIHVTAPGGSQPRCGATGGWCIAWEEATRPGGEHFTCGACQADVTGGHKHVPPPLTVEIYVDGEWVDVSTMEAGDNMPGSMPTSGGENG